MSKNSSWSRDDAVAPVMKHFAAHGAPEGGRNTAPYVGHGLREVIMRMLTPFKAVVQLGDARGVMMSYNEIDDIPAHVHPLLYDSLDEWGFDGFVISDDVGVKNVMTTMMVTGNDANDADTMEKWFNAGGMISFYDYPLADYLNITQSLIDNGSVARSTLESKARDILGVKYDLGLFSNPYIPDSIDPYELVEEHVPLTIEAARKSIVMLENKNSTLPIDISSSEISTIALIGPFCDQLNYGDYSGNFGAYPVANSSTIQQGMINSMQAANSSIRLVKSWGANSWLYNSQSPIPVYHLSANGMSGGLQATYFADTNSTEPTLELFETRVRD